jgi:hypothetical protein
VPLIGVVALGGEAGSWYVTKQHAQNAADAAAYAGAYVLLCASLAGVASPPACSSDTQSFDYRGKEFAAQNGFCNAGTTTYPGSTCATSLPPNVSQSVTMNQLATWNGTSGTFVQAIVSQTQPAYLAAILGLSDVTVGGQAVAQVKQATKPCVLALADPINFGGSTTVNSSNCGVQSNNTSSSSISITGSGNTVNVASLSGSGGCSQNGSLNTCASVNYALPVLDPLSGLNSAMASLSTASFANGQCGTQPMAYTSANHCYNTSLGSASLNGVYFFSGAIKINGNPKITGTATLVFLPGSTLTISGNPQIQLQALSTVSSDQVPSALSSVTSLMSDLLIYDPQIGNVQLTGNSQSYFSGITYAPNADLTFTGNNTSSTPGSNCSEIIAKGISFSGGSYFDNYGCPASVKVMSLYVALVQ